MLGLLTPEWIIEQLRKREKTDNIESVFSTLVLLVDSCYSGVWTERISGMLNESNLKQNEAYCSDSLWG